MSIYMQISGVNGNATDQHHQNWIQVEHINMKMHRNVYHRVGFGETRESSVPHFRTLLLTKKADNASSDLYNCACSARSIPQLLIHVCNQPDTQTPSVSYILYNVMVAGFEDHIAESGMPSELITLSYTKIERSYTNTVASGRFSAPKRVGYDLMKAELA